MFFIDIISPHQSYSISWQYDDMHFVNNDRDRRQLLMNYSLK